MNNQKGAVPLILLLGIIGIVAIMFIANAAPFKDRFLSSLYPKDDSKAAENSESEFKSDELLIKFKDTPASTVRTRIASDSNSTIEYQQASESAGLAEFDNYARRNSVVSISPVFKTTSSPVLSRWYKVKLPGTGENIKLNSVKYNELQSKISSFKSLGDVEQAGLNGVFYAEYTPNDPKYPDQWYLPKIEADKAWNIIKGSADIKIAILDTGIDNTHPEFSGKIVKEADFTSSSYGASDRHGHGTHVAGIAAAIMDNSQGVASVAPASSLINAKVIGDSGVGSFYTVGQGITWSADNGANVINMSLGATWSCDAFIQDAVDYAWNKGVVIVAAAGNSSSPTSTQTPANCNNVMSVAATDSNDMKASFSNYGPETDIAAPGVFIWSTYLTSPSHEPYMLMSGTSMASPVVAATAALIKSAKPTLTNAEIIKTLGDTADKIPQTGVLWSNGRVNVRKAIEAVKTKAAFGDFDGDKKADFSVFRPSNSNWYIKTRSTDLGGGFGGNGDIPVIGDYDGDGKMNKAVFRPSNNTWYIDNENPNGTVLGNSGDIPVPGDYNGDGKTDKAIYHLSSGVWETTGGSISWGRPQDAIPVPADYNGDGKVEPAWFLPSSGGWFMQGNSTITYWGGQGDIPVPTDYNGDGKAEIAVFRPAAARWYISGQDPNGTSWGGQGDIPVPADYNGDGKADIAVFRPGNGTWYPYPTGGFSINGIQLGQSGDIPATKRPSYPGYPF